MWRLRRLTQMSTREVAHRVAERWWGFLERLNLVDRGGAKSGATGTGLADAWSQPFFFRGVDPAPERLPEDFRARFPDDSGELLRRARAACEGRLRLFGAEVAFQGDRVDWHRDWENEAAYPLDFYRDIPVFDVGRLADRKRVWELNRQQFLVTLGQAYFLTHEDDYADAAVGLIDSWIGANPPYRGFNWKEALEVGLRLLSWTWTLQLLRGHALPPGFEERVIASIGAQHEFVGRHLSVYSSPNTHILGEALAMLIVGLEFPGLPGAREKAASALAIMETELHRQVREDGSHFEKSAYYHCYALEMFLVAWVYGQRHRVADLSRWRPGLERMGEFLAELVRPDGSLARFGDDDGGKTLRLGRDDYHDPRPLLALCAVLFERPDFKHVAGPMPPEVWWLLGPQGAETYLTMPERRSPPERTLFLNAEVGVIRSDATPEALWVLAQACPWATLTAGHSHGGLLSFEAFVGGRPFLIDPGTFTYSERDAFRDALRRVDAHNTVTIDGQEWWTIQDTFKWVERARLETTLDAAPNSLGVSYRAPVSEGRSIGHRREFRVEGRSSLVVRDSFEGDGRHRLDSRLHFAPGWSVEPSAADEATIVGHGTRVRLVLRGFGEVAWKVLEGDTSPIAGWCSERFNSRTPSSVLILEELEVAFPARRELHFHVERVDT